MKRKYRHYKFERLKSVGDMLRIKAIDVAMYKAEDIGVRNAASMFAKKNNLKLSVKRYRNKTGWFVTLKQNDNE